MPDRWLIMDQQIDVRYRIQVSSARVMNVSYLEHVKSTYKCVM